jgi:uncharacterized protein (TIGR02099 family)
MAKFLFVITRRIAYLFIALFFLLAIFIVCLRAATPILNHHYKYLEAWASKYLGIPVKIGHLEARWEGLHPDLKLQNIAVFSKDKKRELVNVKELQVDIKIIQSLITRKLQPCNIQIFGVNLNLYQTAKMHFSIQGILDNSITQSNQAVEALNYRDVLEWAFTQAPLIFKDIHINWHRSQNVVTRLVVGKLLFNTQDRDHIISGKVELTQNAAANINFYTRLSGDIVDSNHLQMFLYAKAKNFQIKQWLQHLTLHGYHVLDGILNGQLWLNWQDGKWGSVQTLLNSKELKLTNKSNQDNVLYVPRLSGNFFWQPSEHGWQLAAQLHNISIAPQQNFPGVENFSGKLSMQQDQGYLDITSFKMNLDFDKLFVQPLIINKLIGRIQWYQRNDKHWVIKSDNLSADNDNAKLIGQFALLFNQQDIKNPIVSMQVDFDVNNSMAIKKYVPVKILNRSLVNWLEHAFPQGDGITGKVLLRGHMRDFPFKHNDGTFMVDSTIRNSTLHYAADWPNAEKINAHLIFNSNTMGCEINSGNIYGMRVKTVHLRIPDIGKKPAAVNLHGVMLGDAADVLHYLKASPLSVKFGKDLAALNMHGDTVVNLKLDLPLENSGMTKLNGFADFNKVSMNVPTWNLSMQQLHGRLLFTANKLWSETIRGVLFGAPVAFQVDTVKQGSQLGFMRINLNGHIASQQLAEYFNWSKPTYLTGATDYAAVLDLHTANDDHRQHVLHLTSNLRGISSSLPQPLYKQADAIKPFIAQISLGNNQPPKAIIDIGDDLHTALQFHNQHKQPYLYSANVHFGHGNAKLQTLPGLYVDGELANFNLQQWQDYLRTANDANLSAINNNFMNKLKKFLRLVKIRIGKITILQQHLVNTIFAIEPQHGDWLIGVKSVDLDGKVLIPQNFPKEDLQANFTKLTLQKNSFITNNQSTFNPASIPALNLLVANLYYDKNYYGKVDLLIRPGRDSLQIKQMKIDGPLITTVLQGYWKKTQSGKYSSRIHGNIASNDISDLLQQWNIHTSIIMQQGTADFNIGWPDAIYKPQLQQLVGKVELQLGQGRVVDISDAANAKLNLGRILTLLDINRLIMLNFSDFATTGYSFTKMVGTLDLYNGEVATKDLYFDGHVARININGYANLIKQTLNLKLQVTPYITSSVPIVAGVIGGPVAGVAAFVANKMFGKFIDKIVTYNYFVTGNFAKPVIEEIKRKNKM